MVIALQGGTGAYYKGGPMTRIPHFHVLNASGDFDSNQWRYKEVPGCPGVLFPPRGPPGDDTPLVIIYREDLRAELSP